MLQKVMPFSDISPILKRALREFEKYINKSMAIPMPPTLVSMPKNAPSNCPVYKPTKVQIPSKAIPYITILIKVTYVD